MAEWNPSDPRVLGPEFLATGRTSRIPGQGTFVAQRFGSTQTENIDDVRLYVGGTPFTPTTPRVYIAEVLDYADLLVDPVGTQPPDLSQGPHPTLLGSSAYVPNASAVTAGIVTDEGGATGSLWQNIDDGGTVDYSGNYLKFATGSSIDLEMSTAGYAGHGRIAGVSCLLTNVRGTGLETAANNSTTNTLHVAIVQGGGVYGTIVKVVPNNAVGGRKGRAWFDWGEINPVTERPWTEAEIQAFDTGAYEVRIHHPVGDGAGTFCLANVQFVVTYEGTERRHGYAIKAFNGQSSPAWTGDLPLRKPDATVGWAKASGGDYVITVREADLGDLSPSSTSARMSVFGITSTNQTYVPPPTFDGYDWLASTQEDVGATFEYAPTMTYVAPTRAQHSTANVLFGQTISTWTPIVTTFALITDAAAVSIDSQPYYTVSPALVAATTGATEAEFTAGATDNYGRIRLVVGQAGGSTGPPLFLPAAPPDAELVIEVRERPSGTIVGTCRVAVLDEYPSIGLVVAVAEPDADINLVSGTQYYLNLTSTSTNAWSVGVFSALAAYDTATFNGATDTTSPINGNVAVARDMVFIIDRIVDAPTSLTGDDGLLPLPDVQPCPLDGVPYVNLQWVSPGVPDFGSYQLQRDDPVLGWQDVGAITSQDGTAFHDYEARVGIQECYRLRTVQAVDGATSTWVEVCATIPADGPGYYFTNNAVPLDSVAYPDIYSNRPERTYEFPEADEVIYRKMYGRDYQVAFKPTSRRGVTFTRDIVVEGLAAPAVGIGPPAADLLRDLVWAPLPYICVRDNDGNRWYSSVTVPTLSVTVLATALSCDTPGTSLGYLHVVQIRVVQVSGPSATDSNATPDTEPPVGGDGLLYIGGAPILVVPNGDPLELV